MIEEYLFTWEDFVDKCNKLKSFLLHRSINAHTNGKFDDLPAEQMSGGSDTPCTLL